MRAKFRPSASSRSASEWGGIIAIRDRAINRALARASRVIRFNRDFAPRVAGRVAVRSKREPTGGILPPFSLNHAGEGRGGEIIFETAPGGFAGCEALPRR